MTTEQDVARMVGRDEGKDWPAYAWPGGYPILYLCDDGETICPKCMNTEESVHFDGDAYGWRIEGAFIHYEGRPEICSNCSGETESAYGDPDE